jgi:hypothetical protein
MIEDGMRGEAARPGARGSADDSPRMALQRLIQSGAVRIDGVGPSDRPGARIEGRGKVEIDLDAPEGTGGDRPGSGASSRILTRTSISSSSTKPAGHADPRDAARRGAAPPRELRAGPRRRPVRSAPHASMATTAPGSCIGSTGTRSGLLLLGRTREALDALKAGIPVAFDREDLPRDRAREPRFDSEWDHEASRAPRRPPRPMSVVPKGRAGTPRPILRVRERLGAFALRPCSRITRRRTHQVRVHLASIGMRRCRGEALRARGAAGKLPRNAPKLAARALHAPALALAHTHHRGEALRFRIAGAGGHCRRARRAAPVGRVATSDDTARHSSASLTLALLLFRGA